MEFSNRGWKIDGVLWVSLLGVWWDFFGGFGGVFSGLWSHLGLFELDKEYLKNKTQV